MLKENDKSYKALFEQAGDAIFKGDSKGNFIQVNSAACKLTGFSQKELLSMNMKEIFEKQQLDSKPLRYDKLNDSVSIITERNILTKSGKYIPVEMNSKRIDNSSYLSIMRDLSYRKKIEKDIKENEEKFRKLFSAAPNGIILINNDGIILDCNDAYCKLLNSSKNEILNTHVIESISENDKNVFVDRYPLLISTGKAEGEVSLKTKDGENICTWRSATAFYNEDGSFNGAIVHTHDITEKNRAQNEIKAREARLNAIFNAADNVSFILTSIEGIDSKILEFSPGSESIFGYSRDEIIGQSISILHTSDSIKNFSNYLDKMKKGREGFKGQSIMVKKSGATFTALHTAYPIFDDKNKLSQILAVTIDITKRKELETQLRHSQKMEAIGLMASGIAHNFNNILQAIIGYVDFAKEGLQITDQRFKDIDQINQHVKRATILTKDLLAVGKERYMSKNNVNLVDIIIPIIELEIRKTNNKINVTFDANQNVPIILADEKQIDQVIRNIFINAMDAMPVGGDINILLKQVLIDDDFCNKKAWAKKGKYLLLSISDTGIGMDQETQGRIFEPYFTTKNFDQGTGLGLSSAFGIILQHNGILHVISNPGKGSTFEIYLPL
ncbi:MAG: PAS domain S-box protein [Bacteroidota bacterium]